MSWKHDPAETGPPRVLIVSLRRLQPQVSRGLRFEFEDHVRALDAADLAMPDGPGIASPLVRRAARIAERVAPGVTGLLARERLPLAPRYDLLFVALETLADLPLLQPLDWLRRRAAVSTCFVDEVWCKGLRERTGELRLLRQFDQLLVGTAGSVEEVQALTGRPCRYLAPSVDAAALCPYPEPVARAIDLYAMGRRSPRTHQAMLELAERRRWLYLYDTVQGSWMPSHQDHRRLLGSLLRRTRYFLAYPGKVDVASETGGQQEIGFRYFEGAAAGAVLVGEAPATPWFGRLLDWPDAVVPLPWGSTEPEQVLAPLEADAPRVERVRRASVAGSLLRHDHVHRWAEVLQCVGLAETTAMAQRRLVLERLAALVRPGG
jgi:hypothetical protein